MTRTVVVATDSFKGTMSAAAACSAIAEGWASVHPDDRLEILPQADGGEGTLDAMLAADDRSRLRSAGMVAGPDGRPVEGTWLELADGTAVVELAQMSGITLLDELAPATATTRGFGETIAAALRAGATRVELCVGGSASSDGGAGALAALGARLLDDDDAPVPDGALGLLRLARADLSAATSPPPRGVGILTDVESPLLGPEGAIAVFGPQKGVRDEDRPTYEAALARWAEAVGGDPDQPGMGAAGGTTFGLAALWPVEIASGARRVAALTGLVERVAAADVLISGEGRYDGQSSAGKVVGHAAQLAREGGAELAIVTGSALAEAPGELIELATLASSVDSAMAHPERWARLAGVRLAERFRDREA